MARRRTGTIVFDTARRSYKARVTVTALDGSTSRPWHILHTEDRDVAKRLKGELVQRLGAQQRPLALTHGRADNIDAAPTCAGVYIVQRGSSGPIKIGMAANARRRLRALQTSCAEPLVMLALLRGGPRQESELHARFAAHRMLGEWFAPAAEILAFVEGAAS